MALPARLRWASTDPVAGLPLLVAALTAGVLVVMALPALPALAVLAVLALTVLVPWRGRAAWGAFVLGVLLVVWHGQAYLQQRWPAARHNEIVEATGTVISLPSQSPDRYDDGRTWRFVFAPDNDALPARIRVSWYRSDAAIEAGQCWSLTLKMRTPHGSMNPGGFDYESSLMRQGIDALASVRSAKACPMPSGHVVLRLRQYVVDRIRSHLGDSRAAALIAALTVGDTTGLSDSDWQTFRRTGTTHLVAISGFNLAIVSGFAFFVIRWLWSLWPGLCLRIPAQRAAVVGAGALAGFYALLAGFEPPVTRSLVMTLVVLLAALSHRRNQVLRGLLIAWGLILLCDPLAILSPGMWLSFGAVAAIFYVALGSSRQPAWRAALWVQLFLSVGLTPLTVHFFHGLSWLAPLVNLLAVPVFSVLTPLVFVAVVVSMLSGSLGGLLLHASAWALDWVGRSLDWIAATAPAAWLPDAASLPVVLLAVLGCVIAFAPRGVPLRQLALPAVVPLMWPHTIPVHALQVSVLDVGQGLSVVVRTAHHALLFDAGPAYPGGFDAGRSIVVPYLLEQGVGRIDRLVLSHGDNDHAGGVPAVRQLLDVGDEIGTPNGRPCRDGQQWTWDGVRFEILHPGTRHWSKNNSSCVLRIDGAYSVLLPGDIERGAEHRLLHDHADELRADLLITPHHGSRTSSSSDFVAAVDPQVVVHSAGWRSRYGHPKPVVVARYAAIGAHQFTTGVQGEVTVTPGDGHLHAAAWRVGHAHWWNEPPRP